MLRSLRLLCVLSLAHLILGCASSGYGTSLMGEPLVNARIEAEQRKRLEAALKEARAEVAANPDSEEAVIWHGRRLAYLAQYPEAIEVYTEGLERYPDSYRLLRHRGHRYITTRQFESAIDDLERAWELARDHPDQFEPDGQPNERGIPLGTDHGNILYHLGLARYLVGDWDAAEEAFAARVATHCYADNVASTAYWRFLALSRAGRGTEAMLALTGVVDGADIIENTSYQELCLLYRGERRLEDLDAADGAATPSSSALAYGLSAWLLIRGESEQAIERWEAIVADKTRMDAFGYIAAEAELARQRR